MAAPKPQTPDHLAPVATTPGGGEPTSLLGLRLARHADVPRTSGAELRERDAVVRAGLWGVVVSTLVLLVASALVGLMRGA